VIRRVIAMHPENAAKKIERARRERNSLRINGV
jgi:hypothetical protein